MWYSVVVPLAILPNSVPFNLKLLKFSDVAFSILILTLLSSIDPDFLHPINKDPKAINTTKSFNLIFYFPDTRSQHFVATLKFIWKANSHQFQASIQYPASSSSFPQT